MLWLNPNLYGKKPHGVFTGIMHCPESNKDGVIMDAFTNGEDGRRRSSSCLTVFSGILWFAVLSFYSPIIQAALEEGHESPKSFCKNTVQGRYLLSDDHGYVCGVMSVDPSSGCCPESSEQFSCHGCNLISQCCNSYEFCVSCCLDPARTPQKLAMKVKVAKQATAGTYGSVFNFCAGRVCFAVHATWISRISARVHENAYASELHHCFSLQPNSSGPDNTHSEVELSDISILVGRQGQSCNSVCKSKGQSCILSRLTALNKCGVLQKYMNCKGACVASLGADHPAEVADNAPRHLNPGACLFSKKQSVLSCDGLHPYTRRLCPCA